MRENLPVLVVGAGPVGLTAAAELRRRDVPVRLIDKAAEPSRLTKALMVWPRTLDILRQLGGADHIVDHGLPVDAFRYYSDARVICNIQFDPLTQPVVLPQPDVEDLLRAKLTELGGATEWRTRLTAVDQDRDGVTATLRDADGAERTERFAYLIGCDGAGSTVRELLGLEFHGATYPNLFILADVRVDGDLQFDAVHYYISGNGILVMVPMPNGRFRIFTAGPPTLKPEDLDVPLLQRYVDERGPGGLRLRDVGWHTTFSIHARHTDQFHRGRVFLAGDAAHIHSPAGGQGLNTGVTDANNLAWKLALVHSGAVPATVLDTYGAERATVASAVVKQAEWQTKAWLFKKAWQIGLRDNGARLAQRTGVFDRWYTPWLAGLTNHYTDGPLIEANNRYGSFVSGRLAPTHPVVALGAAQVSSLREVLPSARYTLLITLPPGRALDTAAIDPLVARYEKLLDVRVLDGFGVLHDPLSAETRGAGFRYSGAWHADRFTAALVRPDHYVAAVDRTADLPRIRAHLSALTESVPTTSAEGLLV